MNEIITLLQQDRLDLKTLLCEKSIQKSPIVLDHLLEEEQKEFSSLLETHKNNISFSTFRSFSKLDTYFTLIDHLNSIKSTETLRKTIEDFEPKYIDFGNEIAYSKKYFNMLVYCEQQCPLDDEQRSIIEKSIEHYRERGIDLPLKKKNRLKAINKELSELQQKFSNNVLDHEEEFEYLFVADTYIKEMAESDKQIAKKRAEEKGKSGYLFDLTYSSYPLVMSYCSDKNIREYFYKAKTSIASAGKYDNREHVLSILKLRNEKAKLLGKNNYAELSLTFKMAETANEIESLLLKVKMKAIKKAKEEIEELKDYFGLSEIDARDTTYYFRKYKEERYHFDERILKNYFEFEQTLSGLFSIVNRLYSVEMREIYGETSLRYLPEVRVYEVFRKGEFIAYFIGDYFYRPGKRGGAWANNLRPKSFDSIEKKYPLVVNVCSFQKNGAGKTLLSRNDTETLFHEFGHALHEMLSKSQYSDLSGFMVEWDFVELPSQIMENWAKEKGSLSTFAFHSETQDVIPEDVFSRMQEIETIGSGNFLLRQLELSLMDMKLHTCEEFNDVEELEKFIIKQVNTVSLFKKGEEYKMFTSFSHIFDGGYAAGYYSYMWAEIIESQIFSEFKELGIFSDEVAKKFYHTILSAGSIKKAKDMFKEFSSTDISPEAYLRRYGI